MKTFTVHYTENLIHYRNNAIS